MELVFKRSEQEFAGNPAYEVEFNATADFNLHIERPEGGRFLVYQKSVADGKYDIVDGIGYKDHKDVIDFFVQVPLAPMYLRIVSESEVKRGVAIFAE